MSAQIRLLRSGDKADTVYDAPAVQAKFGVRADQIVDLLSLIGDQVDNIPGVPGVGEKTAADLLRRFDNLDALLARTSEIERPKLREAVQTHAERLRRNRQLIRLRQDLDLPVTWADLKVQPPDYPALLAVAQCHGFKSLLAELQHQARQGADLFAQL